MSNLPILFYLTGILVVGLAYSFRRDRSSDDYFYGGSTVGQVALGSSLTLSNILRYQIILLPLAALDAFWTAVALSVGVVALSYRLRRRETGRDEEVLPDGIGRWYVSALVFLSIAVVQIAGVLAIGHLLVADVLKVDYSSTVLLVIVFAGVYAIVGGFSAVAHTQAIQGLIFVGGLVALAVMKAVPSAGSFILPPSSFASLTSTGAILGLPVVSLWLWHYDRYSFQQARRAENPATANRGVLIAGVIAILSGGLMAFAQPVTAGGTKGVGDPILLLVCMSLLMASFAASFTCTAEIVSHEFFRRLKPDASEQEAVLVGRLATAAVAGLTIIMIPIAQSFGTRFLDLFVVLQASLFPPLTAIYAAKLMFKAAPIAGIVPSLVAGEAVGLVRVVAHTIAPDPGSTVFGWFLSMDHYLFAFCLFCFSLTVLYVAGAALSVRLRAADRFT